MLHQVSLDKISKMMVELRIKDLMKKKGLSITDLANKLGINRVSLSVGLRKDANPKLETLLKIANALEVELSELFVKKEDQKPTVSGFLEVKEKGIFKIECFDDLEKIYLELKERNS